MITLRWLGQGGYLVSNGECSFAIDPYLSNSVAREDRFERLLPLPMEPEQLKPDLVFCTHGHLDHLDPDTIGRMEPDRLFAGPDSCCDHLIKLGIPPEKVTRFNRGDSFSHGGFQFTATYAEHTDDSIGLLAEYAGKRIYFTGDSLYHKEVGVPCDLIVVCINGKLGNMTAQEAAMVAVKCHAKAAIPSHYGMFRENTADPQKFVELLAGTKIKTMVMDFNETIQIQR